MTLLFRFILFSVALTLAACGTEYKICAPGQVGSCECPGQEDGSRTCLEGGTGWTDCQCGCLPDCQGKECGSDGCQGTCLPGCQEGYLCNSSGQCYQKQECRSAADCDPGYYCDLIFNECREEICTPQCGNKCCGPDGCGGVCLNTCEPGTHCNRSTCTCESTICCPGSEQQGYIAGRIMQFPPSGHAAQLNYAIVSAMDSLTNPNPQHIYDGDTDNNGEYKTDCFDMTPYSLALMVLSDDDGFDGTSGSWYPTYSGVMEITTNADRTCVPRAPDAWAIPNEIIRQLKLVPGLERIDADGFAVVFITDQAEIPVEGAVLMKHGSPPEQLEGAVYPDFNFTDFSGTQTSANGIVVIPGPMGLTNVIPVKPGMTWEEGPIGAVEGFCFTRPLIADD